MKRSFTTYAKRNIREIHKLSKRYNGKDKKHMAVLLGLVREHSKEINELYKKKNKHFLTETGDLLVLCLEILLENKTDMDKVAEICYKRYKAKLGQKLKYVNGHIPYAGR